MTWPTTVARIAVVALVVFSCARSTSAAQEPLPRAPAPAGRPGGPIAPDQRHPPPPTAGCYEKRGLGVRYQQGESWSYRCEKCTCSISSSRDPPRARCTPIPCPTPTCPEFQHAVKRGRDCCPQCVEYENPANCTESGVRAHRAVWYPTVCTRCTCINGTELCGPQTCQYGAACRVPLQLVSEVISTECCHGRCREQSPDACYVPRIESNVTVLLKYKVGQSWPVEQGCQQCTCQVGGIQNCTECPRLDCRRDQVQRKVAGQCCRQCVNISNPLSCMEPTGISYTHGQEWSRTPCTVCYCFNGTAMCDTLTCQALRGTCSPPAVDVSQPDSCCADCRVIPHYCPSPTPPPHGAINGAVDRRRGKCYRYNCSQGFRRAASNACCDYVNATHGRWSAKPRCQAYPNYCPKPLAPRNGRFRRAPTDYSLGDQFDVECNRGFSPVASARVNAGWQQPLAVVTCETPTGTARPGGSWSTEEPYCIKIRNYCRAVKAPRNGQVAPSKPRRLLNECYSYTCDAGFTASSSRKVCCRRHSRVSGRWSQNPQCTAMEAAPCSVQNITRSHNDTWETTECESCLCRNGKPDCHPIRCQSCRQGYAPTKTQGQCCAICTRKNTCVYDRQEYTNGERFAPRGTSCFCLNRRVYCRIRPEPLLY